MYWTFLFIAGALEIVWAVLIRYTDGFTLLWPSVLTIGAMGLSFYFLSQAIKGIPIGTAYAVWVGIGAAGVALAGMIWFREPAELMRIAALALILAGVVSLKLLAPPEPAFPEQEEVVNP